MLTLLHGAQTGLIRLDHTCSRSGKREGTQAVSHLLHAPQRNNLHHLLSFRPATPEDQVPVGLLEEAERRRPGEPLGDRHVDPVIPMSSPNYELQPRTEPRARSHGATGIGAELAGAVDLDSTAEQLELDG